VDDWIGILLVIGFIVSLVGILIYARWAEKQRKLALAEVAESLGLEYFPDGRPDLLNDISDFGLFNIGHSRKQTKVISGETDDVRIAIFDYRYTTGSGKNQSTRHQSVIALQSPQLQIPTFNMRPEGMFDKIGGALGFQDIDFPSHPNFSKMFVLQGPDETQIRDFFDDELLSQFEKLNGYTIAGRNGALIMYQAGKRIKPDQIKEYLGKAYEVFGWLIDRQQRAPA